MTTRQTVLALLSQPNKWLADYILALADVLEKSPSAPFVGYASDLFGMCLDENSSEPKAIRSQIFETARDMGWFHDENLLIQVPLPHKAIAAAQQQPTLAPQPVDQAVYEGDRMKIGILRTPRSKENGALVAKSARKFDHKFFWIKSGPRDPETLKPTGKHQAKAYKLKQTWSKEHQEGGGFVKIPKARNDFAVWLYGDESAPLNADNARMNCWEAVFYVAYKAAVLDKVRLRAAHDLAALQYRDSGSDAVKADAACYYQAICKFLGLEDSVPYVPDAGLFPEAGDIVSWDGSFHVAVSLGRTISRYGDYEDWVFSLYCNNNNRASITSIAQISTGTGISRPRYCPCPF